MRKQPNVKIERYRRMDIPQSRDCSGTNCGAFQIGDLVIIASNGGGWDHVSVSTRLRCPTWEEMCRVKELFFKDDEAVMQLHPPKASHINCHEFCLHLWRPQSAEERAELGYRDEHEYPQPHPIPMPPKIMV